MEDGGSVFCNSDQWHFSKLFRVLDAAREILSYDCMYNACFQSIGKLLKMESSPSSIFNALKASTQAISFHNTFESSQVGKSVVLHSSTSLLVYIIKITWIRLELQEFIRDKCYINHAIFLQVALQAIYELEE